MKRLANPCYCDRLHLWTDGQPFKGKSPAQWEGHCTVVIDNDGESLTPGLLWTYADIGDKASNECEYSGLILALEWALSNHRCVHIIIDSQLIIGHLEKDFRCEPHLRPYRDRVRELIEKTDARVSWQGRDYNKAGWVNAEVLLARARAKRQKERRHA